MAAVNAGPSAFKCDGCNQEFSEERNFMVHALSCIDLAELDKKAGRPKRSYDIAVPTSDIPKTDKPPGISIKDPIAADTTSVSKTNADPSKDTPEVKLNRETSTCEPQNNNVKRDTNIEKTNLGATAHNIGTSDKTEAATITTGDIKDKLETPIKNIGETRSACDMPKMLEKPGNTVARYSSKDTERVSNNSGTDSDTTIPDRDTIGVNTAKKRKIYSKGKGLDSIVQKLTSSIAHKSESKKLSESLTLDNRSKSASKIGDSSVTIIPEKSVAVTTPTDKSVPLKMTTDKGIPTTTGADKLISTTIVTDKDPPRTTVSDKGDPRKTDVPTKVIPEKSVPTVIPDKGVSSTIPGKSVPPTKAPERKDTKPKTDNESDILPGKSVNSRHLNASSGDKAPDAKTSSVYKVPTQKNPDVSKSDTSKLNGKNIFESIKAKPNSSKYESFSGTSKTSKSDEYSHYMSPGSRGGNMTPFDIVEMVYRPSLASEENIGRRSPVLSDKGTSSKGFSTLSKAPSSSPSLSGLHAKVGVKSDTISQGHGVYRSSISKEPLGRSESPRMISLLHSSKASKSSTSEVKTISNKPSLTNKTPTVIKSGPSVSVQKSVDSSSFKDEPSIKNSSSTSTKTKSVEGGIAKSVEIIESKSVESSVKISVDSSRLKCVETSKTKSGESGKTKSIEIIKPKSEDSIHSKSIEITKSKSCESNKANPVESNKSGHGKQSKTKSTKLKASDGNSSRSTGESDVKKTVKKDTSDKRQKEVEKEKVTKNEDISSIKDSEQSKKTETSTSGLQIKGDDISHQVQPPVLDAPQLDKAKEDLKSEVELPQEETTKSDSPPTLEKFDPLKKFKCIKCNFIAYSVTDFAKHLSNLEHIKGVKKFEALKNKEKAKKDKEKLKKGKITKAKEMKGGKLKQKKLKAVVKKQLKTGKVLKTKTKTSKQLVANKVKKAALKAIPKRKPPKPKAELPKVASTTPKQTTDGVTIGTPIKDSKGFSCKNCKSWSTPNKPTYIRHMMTQHDVLMSDFYYSCTYCELRTTDGYDFNRHIKTTRHLEKAPKDAGKKIEWYKVTAEEAQSAFTKLKSPPVATSVNKNKLEVNKSTKRKGAVSSKKSKVGKRKVAIKDNVTDLRGRPRGSKINTKRKLKLEKTKSHMDDSDDDDDDIVLSKLATAKKKETNENNKESPKGIETKDDTSLSETSSSQDTSVAINDELANEALKSTKRGLKSLGHLPEECDVVKAKKHKFMKKEMPKRRSTRSRNAQPDDGKDIEEKLSSVAKEETVSVSGCDTESTTKSDDEKITENAAKSSDKKITENTAKSSDKKTTEDGDTLTEANRDTPQAIKSEKSRAEADVSKQTDPKSEVTENSTEEPKEIGKATIKKRKGAGSKSIKANPKDTEEVEPKNSIEGDESANETMKDAAKVKQGEQKPRKRRVPIELPPLIREIKKRNVNSIYMRPARPAREAKAATPMGLKNGKPKVDARNELFEKNDNSNGKKGTSSNGRNEKSENVPVTRYFRKDIEAKLKRKFVLQAQNKKVLKRGLALRKKVEKPVGRLTRAKPQIKSAQKIVNQNAEKIKSDAEDVRATVQKSALTPEKNLSATIIYKCTMCTPGIQSKNRYDFTRHLNSKLHISNAEKIPGALGMVALDFVVSGNPRTPTAPAAKPQMKPQALLKTSKSQQLLNKAKLKANQRLQKPTSSTGTVANKQKLSNNTSMIAGTSSGAEDIKPKAKGRKRMPPSTFPCNQDTKKPKRSTKKQNIAGSDTGQGPRNFSLDDTLKLVTVTKPDEEDIGDLKPDQNEETEKNTLQQQIETQNMAHNLSNIANGNLVSTDPKLKDVVMETVELNDDSFEDDSWRNALKAENDIDINERNATLFFSDMDTQVEQGDLINVDKSCILYASKTPWQTTADYGITSVLTGYTQDCSTQTDDLSSKQPTARAIFEMAGVHS